MMVGFIALIVAAATVYLFVGGVVGRWFRDAAQRACGAGGHYDCLHLEAGVVAGVLWPVTAPFCGGQMSAAFFTSDAREKRRKTRHDRRMSELNAQKELTQLELDKANAALKFLQENGVRAEVQGMFNGS